MRVYVLTVHRENIDNGPQLDSVQVYRSRTRAERGASAAVRRSGGRVQRVSPSAWWGHVKTLRGEPVDGDATMSYWANVYTREVR